MTIANQIIQVTSYKLTGSAEAFTDAIEALSQRAVQGGPDGLLRYSFYVNAHAGTASAVIVYQNPEAWLGQHDFVASQAEYQDFYKTIDLTGLRFFGNLSPEIRQWLDERNVEYDYAGRLAAGFVR